VSHPFVFALVISAAAAGNVLAQKRDSMPAGHRHTPGMAHGAVDSAAKALKKRGGAAMRVDQDRAQHRFDSLRDGGRIELQNTDQDPAAVAGIRAHFAEIEAAFQAGDFAIPMFVHDGEVPGTKTMAAKRDRIEYHRRDLPAGAELRLRTRDPEAIRAIHEFLAFQRRDHRAPGATR
jgi:hypothetical protein